MSSCGCVDPAGPALNLHWRELLTNEGSAPSSTSQFDLVINNLGRLRGRQRQPCKHRDIARGLGVFQGNLCSASRKTNGYGTYLARGLCSSKARRRGWRNLDYIVQFHPIGGEHGANEFQIAHLLIDSKCPARTGSSIARPRAARASE